MRPTGSTGHANAQRRRHRAYALLLTLILLAVVATTMGVAAEQGLSASLRARRELRDIQRKWLVESAAELLEHADQALIDRETDRTDSDDPVSHRNSVGSFIEQTLDLGHHQVTITLADEQAKANLNTLYDRYERSGLMVRLQRLAASTGAATPPANPRAVGRFEATAVRSTASWPAFVWFDQLYAGATHPQIEADFLNGLMKHTTLWGDGRVRIDRASNPALRAVLTPLLSDAQIDRLDLEGLTPSPEDTPNAPFGAALNLTDRQRAGLVEQIRTDSAVFSVRLRIADGRRNHQVLLVSREESPPTPSTKALRFNW